MDNSDDNTMFSKRFLMILMLLSLGYYAKADDSECAYSECKSVVEEDIRMSLGHAYSGQQFYVDKNFRIESIEYDDDDIDIEWDPDRCEAIHFNVDLGHCDFFDEMIRFIIDSDCNHNIDYVYKIRVSELYSYDKKEEIYIDSFNLMSDGSYKFEITQHRELTVSDNFIFKRNGLIFASKQFLKPLYKRVNNWFTTDCWGDWTCDEFVQWTFVVLCGRIVDATLLIEYGTGDFITIDLK